MEIYINFLIDERMEQEKQTMSIDQMHYNICTQGMHIEQLKATVKVQAQTLED